MVCICLVVWQGQGSHGPPPRAAPHAAKTSALPVCRCSLQDVLVFGFFLVFLKKKLINSSPTERLFACFALFLWIFILFYVIYLSLLQQQFSC